MKTETAPAPLDTSAPFGGLSASTALQRLSEAGIRYQDAERAAKRAGEALNRAHLEFEAAKADVVRAVVPPPIAD
jgi:hypothetical protein